MLKTNVADVLLGTGATKGLANTVQSTTTAGQKDLTGSFANTLNSASDKTEPQNVNQSEDVKQGKVVVENKPVREVAEAKEQPKNETLDDDVEISAAKEIIDEVKQIVEKVKSEFEVTDEAIEEAMQILGFSMQDLFNPKELQNLIMQVTGTTDSIELITNDNLYKGIGEVMNLMNDLKNEVMDEFNITEGAFDKIISNSEMFETEKPEDTAPLEEIVPEIKNSDEPKNVEKTAVPVVGKEIVETEAVLNVQPKEITQEENAVADSKAEIITEKPVKVDDDNTDDKSIKVEVKVEKPETVATTDTTGKTSTENETGNDNHQEKRNSHSNGDEVVTNTVTQFTTTTNTVGDVVQVVESYRDVAGSQEIMRQVTEYMKVNISADSTSMEMQLHPASLGTVNMQVVSNNGQVTAHFTVQNEAVKAVLETQLLSLQETLNEQGTKVSAIEVTVANYNLDKGSENQPNESNSNNHKKGYGKRSSIDLNSLDSFDELEEEEALEAKVMEMNGNTVSYTV